MILLLLLFTFSKADYYQKLLFDDCAPAPQNETTFACGYENLTCVNGGTFNAAACERFVPCGGQTASEPYMWPLHNCSCPDGFAGTDCAIVEPDVASRVCGAREAPPGHRYVYDDALLNVDAASKHVECFADAFLEPLFHLRRHRFNVTIISHKNNGTFSIAFNLLSRHRQWVAERVGYGLCAPALSDIDARLMDCVGVTYTDAKGARLSANYTCANVTFTSCSKDWNATQCSQQLWQYLQFIAPPVTLNFAYNATRGAGYSEAVFLAGAFTVLLQCRTGECALGIHQDHRRQSRAWLWVLAGAAASTLLVLIGVLLLARRKRREEEAVAEAAATERQPLLLTNADLFYDDDDDDEECSLVFQNVSFETRSGRRVLHDVGGRVAPGEVVAVLGASGAGKSTLLDVLAGRRRDGVARGRVACAARRIAYMPQDDVFLATATVRETLCDAMALRGGGGGRRAPTRAQLAAVLGALRLEAAAATRLAHASGGERRRTALAVELLLRPRVLLADEPLTGLDSHAARLVLAALGDLAQTRRTAVLISVHQPTRAAFCAFDRVLLLTRAGRVAFFGAPSDALRRFGATEPEQLVRKLDAIDMVDGVSSAALAPVLAAAPDGDDAARDRFWARFTLLFHRALRHLLRDRRLLLLQWTLSVGVGAFIGGAFYQLDDELAGTQNRTGVLFFTVLYFALAALSSLPVLLEQRALFEHERAACAYSTAAFYAAQLAADLVPLRVAPPLAYGVIVYAMVGLNTSSAWRLLTFGAALVLTNLVATAACFAVSAATRRATLATLAAALGFLFSLLFGGLLLNAPVPQLASFIYYAFATLMSNEFTGRQLVFNPTFNGKVIVSVPITGQEWIDNFGIEPGHRARNLLVLGALVIVFFFAGFMTLRLKKGG